MALTDINIKTAERKPKPYKLFDSDGMYGLVRPDGAVYWRLDYRFLGTRKTLALGVYPDVSLSAARKARDQARAILREGKDPGAERKAGKATAKLAAANTFQAIAEEWTALEEKKGRSEDTLSKGRWLLGMAYPDLGRRPIADITPQEALIPLKKVEARGTLESARRMRATCSRVCRHAIITGRALIDPFAALGDALIPPVVEHHAAIDDPKAIGGLLRAIDAYQGQPATRWALQLAPLLFVRPGELRRAEWSEFQLEGAAPEWRIPAAKMKMREDHRVPLSRQALAILAELRSLTGGGKYLFPSIRTPARPMSENTLNAALRRLGYTGDEMVAHGFRGMASTRLNEMKGSDGKRRWDQDVIERQLAHKEKDKVRDAYNHADHWDERLEMMRAWADYLDQQRQVEAIAKAA